MATAICSIMYFAVKGISGMWLGVVLAGIFVQRTAGLTLMCVITTSVSGPVGMLITMGFLYRHSLEPRRVLISAAMMRPIGESRTASYCSSEA